MEPLNATIDAVSRRLSGLRGLAARLENAGPVLAVSIGTPPAEGESDGRLTIQCAWRLDSPTRTLASSQRDDLPPLPPLAIVSGHVSGPAGDLELELAGGLVLRAFCDARGLGEGRDYLLHLPGTRWKMGPSGRVRREDEGGRVMSGGELVEALRAGLETLRGKACWCAVPLGPHGHAQFGFGRRIPRAMELPDTDAPDEFRLNFPEIGLSVECSWRLETPQEVLCTARDALVRDGRLAAGLARVVGAKLQSAAIDRPAGDLVAHFENGLILRVFADRSGGDASEDNYTLFLPGETFVVGASGVVRHEKTSRGAAPLRIIK